ncbi:hypothetical protein U9M48_012202 [Paspalum notatum var. saurae]|uniref:Uncharacterized protein n=1 Tax=Paspalum notatum var. saurae TaxID=547442 RepID=A0AAQ3SXU1_PASNO
MERRMQELGRTLEERGDRLEELWNWWVDPAGPVTVIDGSFLGPHSTQPRFRLYLANSISIHHEVRTEFALARPPGSRAARHAIHLEDRAEIRLPSPWYEL